MLRSITKELIKRIFHFLIFLNLSIEMILIGVTLSGRKATNLRHFSLQASWRSALLWAAMPWDSIPATVWGCDIRRTAGINLKHIMDWFAWDDRVSWQMTWESKGRPWWTWPPPVKQPRHETSEETENSRTRGKCQASILGERSLWCFTLGLLNCLLPFPPRGLMAKINYTADSRERGLLLDFFF